MPEINFESIKEKQNELLVQYGQGLITKEQVMSELGGEMWNALTVLIESL